MTKLLIAVLLLYISWTLVVVTEVTATESSIRAGQSAPFDYDGSSSILYPRRELNSLRYQLDNDKKIGVVRRHFLRNKLTKLSIEEDRNKKEGTETRDVNVRGNYSNEKKENNSVAPTDASAEELHKWVESFRPHRLYTRLETEKKEKK